LHVLQALAALNWLAVLAATAALYVLGGVWYSPALFGPRWRAGVGFVPPDGWKPGALLYLAPLAGCFVVTLATALLVTVADAHSPMDGIILGLIVGLGYAGAVAGVDATAPSHPRPGPVALIVGAYWTVGLMMVAVMLSVWR
jgi:formate/nitrite transporter FocA (FNT family)